MEVTEIKVNNAGLLYSTRMSFVRIEAINQKLITKIKEIKPIEWDENDAKND